jgi:hypothetical protein
MINKNSIRKYGWKLENGKTLMYVLICIHGARPEFPTANLNWKNHENE